MLIKGMPPEAKHGQMVALDVEMFGQEKYKIHRPTGTFACLSIALEGDPNVYQIYDEKEVGWALLALNKGHWVIHNSLYDLTQLRRYAEIKERPIWDTQLVERNLFGGYYDDFSLKALARRWESFYLGKETRDEFEKVTEMTPEMQEYAALDADITLRIAKKQYEEKDSIPAYFRIDMPAIFPILDMPPIKVNVPEWRKYADEMARLGKEIETEIGVNVMSSQQVKAFAAKQGIHIQDAQAATLEEYKDNEAIAKVLQAKSYRKASSTYGHTWLDRYVEDGDLVYPSPHVTGAETGRMSYSDPNLQNIPQRKMPYYRTLFISKYGKLIVSDISQQEPCILAYESQDEALLEAVRKGEDLHQTVADAVGRDRSTGKVINLATSYGMTAYGMALRLGISEDEAQRVLNQYFQRFRGVFAWISRQRREAYGMGYVKTVAGRRIHLNPHNSQWENNAINGPIQGGASDFTKMWIRKIWDFSHTENIPYTLVGVVHDETLLDPPREYFAATKGVEREAFHATARELFGDIPFRQETKSGPTWACKNMKEEVEDDSDND